jgi:hypothetical protein
MGLRAETRDELRKELVSKIHGQPRGHDITTLKKNLVAIAASIPSGFRGGNHGHAGIIVKATKCLAIAGEAFTDPIHPGFYPTGLPTTAAAGTRARAEAKHKESLAEYEFFKGVKQALKDIILEAVEHDYLLEIDDETLGFLNQMPKQMIDHLKIRGGALDFADTCENICNGYLYVLTQHLVILKGIYGFKFPKRFLEISSRDLTSSLLFFKS